jgi:hypothetical protein
VTLDEGVVVQLLPNCFAQSAGAFSMHDAHHALSVLSPPSGGGSGNLRVLAGDDRKWPEPPNHRVSCLAVPLLLAMEAVRRSAPRVRPLAVRFFVAAPSAARHLSTGEGAVTDRAVPRASGRSAPARGGGHRPPDSLVTPPDIAENCQRNRRVTSGN